jgi:hypothetical protein
MVEADSAMWYHNAVKTDASCARSTQKWTLKQYELMVHTMNELIVLL